MSPLIVPSTPLPPSMSAGPGLTLPKTLMSSRWFLNLTYFLFQSFWPLSPVDSRTGNANPESLNC